MEVLHKYIRHMEALSETGIHYGIDRSIVQTQLRALDIDGICIKYVCMHSAHIYLFIRLVFACIV